MELNSFGILDITPTIIIPINNEFHSIRCESDEKHRVRIDAMRKEIEEYLKRFEMIQSLIESIGHPSKLKFRSIDITYDFN